jgi:hypothetical protein
MILWIFIIFIAIITLFFWYIYAPKNGTDILNQVSNDHTSDDTTKYQEYLVRESRSVDQSDDFTKYPTIHSKCNQNSSCGGDLVCDVGCNRCKKQLSGDCSNNVDCESGLICQNWKCVPIPDNSIPYDHIYDSNSHNTVLPLKQTSLEHSSIIQKDLRIINNKLPEPPNPDRTVISHSPKFSLGETTKESSSLKHVKWNESINQTFYI